MQRFADWYRDAEGRGYPGAVVTVYESGTSNKPQLYNAGGSISSPAPISNPTFTDSNGYFAFAVPNGTYDIHLQGGGMPETIIPNKTIGDTDISSIDASEVSTTSPLTGGVGRSQQDKNNESVSVLDFTGVDPTGVSGSGAGLNAAFASGAGRIYIPDGEYLIDEDLTFGNDVTIEFSPKAFFVASANGRTFFNVSVSAYGSSVIGANLDGNDFTGVTGFDLTNFRKGSALDHPYMTNMENGMIMRSGCYGCDILNPVTFSGVPYPMKLIGAVSAINVFNPSFDNHYGGTITNPADTGTGILVEATDGTFTTNDVRVIGGYVQGFVNGIIDKSRSLEVSGTYFENCSDSDIYLNGSMTATIFNTRHSASTGPVAIKGRNCDGIYVITPQMGSGARSTGLFDFNNTNTNCYATVPGSAYSWNAPLGVTTGIAVCGRNTSFVVTDGSTDGLTLTQNVTAFYTRNGNAVTLFADVTYPATAGTQIAEINLPIPAKSGSAFSGSMGLSDYGSALYVGASTGLKIRFRTMAGVSLQNVNLSGKRLQFSVTYIAA